jgi:hypothetical protein
VSFEGLEVLRAEGLEQDLNTKRRGRKFFGEDHQPEAESSRMLSENRLVPSTTTHLLRFHSNSTTASTSNPRSPKLSPHRCEVKEIRWGKVSRCKLELLQACHLRANLGLSWVPILDPRDRILPFSPSLRSTKTIENCLNCVRFVR